MAGRYNGTTSSTATTSRYNGLNGSNHDSSSNIDKVASASTALDRVLGLLDGFEDDMDCPLCLEEMDISDLNFKPCPCGYQICRFCWNHIKEDLNGRCPACRSPYDDTTVEFKPIKPDELKRLQAAKKLRDKRRKEEAANVKNLANVRVRQRAQVHIQGMTTKIANEDTLNQLKGPEQFGQYGKVVKLFMSKRSPSVTQPISPHPHHQPVNVYVNYRTAAEAASCIAAMDGLTTSDGHKIKAIWGTTRYCPTYLKGVKCNNENCMQAHEPGEEIEAGPTSREEIYTYHAMSDTDMQRAKASKVATQRKPEPTLPATASWASKNGAPLTPIIPNASLPPLSATLKPAPPLPTPSSATPSSSTTSTTTASSSARAIPVSKPQTHPLPARPSSRSKQDVPPPLPSSSSTVKATAATSKEDAASTSQPTPVASSSRKTSGNATASQQQQVPLSGQAPIERPPSVPLFPDLQFGEGTFSFSLDLDVKGKGRESPTLVSVSSMMMSSNSMDDGGIRSPSSSSHLQQEFGTGSMSSSIISDLNNSGILSSPLSSAPSYFGSFDPFADGGAHSSSALDTTSDGGPPSGSSSPPRSSAGDGVEDLSRRGSRFGFARRGSQGVKGGDLASALARSVFGATGRESPIGSFAPPPGMSFPPPLPSHPSSSSASQQHFRPPSSIGFSPLPPATDYDHQSNGLRSPETSALWSTPLHPPSSSVASSALPPISSSSSLPPGVLLRAFASPNQSASASPQVSPRAHPPSAPSASSSLPPGISLAQTPIPAAQFPLPPPNSRSASGGMAPTSIGKDDILALIAAAQSQQQAKSPPVAMQQQDNHRTFFSDPAILSAQLPNHRNGVGHHLNLGSGAGGNLGLGGGILPNGMVGLPNNSGGSHYQWQQEQHYNLQQQQQQQQRGGFGGLVGGPGAYPPPGVRPPQLQAYQQVYRS